MVQPKYQLSWNNWKILWKETGLKESTIEDLEEIDTGLEVEAIVLIVDIAAHAVSEGLIHVHLPGKEEVAGEIHSAGALIAGRGGEGVIVIARITTEHNAVIVIGIKNADLVHETDTKDAENAAVLDVAKTVGGEEVIAEVTAKDLITDAKDLIHERIREGDLLPVVEAHLIEFDTGLGVGHLSD